MTGYEQSAVRGYYRNGMTEWEISSLLDVSLTTVTRIINEYFKKGNHVY